MFSGFRFDLFMFSRLSSLTGLTSSQPCRKTVTCRRGSFQSVGYLTVVEVEVEVAGPGAASWRDQDVFV